MMCLSGSRHVKQCKLLSERGCMESATTQLKLFGAYKGGSQEEVGNERKIRLELWTDDALV